MDISNIINELEKRIQSYLFEVKYPYLEITPYIVEVGALTVSTDETGNIIIQNNIYPTQFSEKGVKTILSKTFKNYNNEIVQPKVYGKNEWYCEQIVQLRLTLGELRKLI